MKNLRRSFLSSNSSILFFPLKIGFIQIRCIFSSSSSVVSNWKIVFVYLAAAFPLLASVSEIDMRITGNWESDLLLTSHMSVVCSYASDEQTFHSISVKWRREQERVRRCSWKRWASCSKFYWIFFVFSFHSCRRFRIFHSCIRYSSSCFWREKNSSSSGRFPFQRIFSLSFSLSNVVIEESYYMAELYENGR